MAKINFAKDRDALCTGLLSFERGRHPMSVDVASSVLDLHEALVNKPERNFANQK